MVYITGDTHGDFSRFSTDCFPQQNELTKDDYVIICGDFGGIWAQEETKKEKYWLDWLDQKPFTTLLLDGNHENFARLLKYPERKWHGGKIHVVRPSVLHLMRGEVFNLEDKTFFVFGGASSHDIKDGILDAEKDKELIKAWEKDYTKLFRVNKISWWKEELPSPNEMENGYKNLEKVNYKVDYILTHSPYTSVLKQLDGGCGLYKPDCLTDYLQDIKQKTDFYQWIFGHMHIDEYFYWDRSCCIYEKITRLI